MGLLLAYLLLHCDRIHSRETLAGVFWGDRNDGKARRCLNTALWRLRSMSTVLRPFHPGLSQVWGKPMNPPPAKTTTGTTFVMRFWREWSGAESRWWGRVEHVESGQGIAFTDMGQMADFLREFVDKAAGREEHTPIRSERRRS